MIHIEKPLKAPRILTIKGSEQTQKDCAAYDLHPSDYRSGSKKFEFNSRIYGAKSVKNALLKAQYNKCCYCESKFLSASYGAVEHFRPKGAVKQKRGQTEESPGYYWLSYDWDNLLVSCERCNSSHKGSLFPLADQKRRAQSHHDDIKAEQPLFVNPAREDPRRHIHFRGEVAMPITKMGRETIQGMGLRRSDLEEARRERLAYLRSLGDIVELGNSSIDQKMRALAVETQEFLKSVVRPEAEYSAMAQDFLDSDSYSTGNEQSHKMSSQPS